MILTDGITPLSLPDDLEWTDEFAWQPVQQAMEYSLTGALVVDVATRQAGRPITLAGRDNAAWVTRAEVNALRAWAAIPGKVLSLTLADARVFSVMFRHHDGGGLKAEPVAFMAPMDDGDFYVVTLNLMEV